MKALILVLFVFTICSSCFATQLISTDEIDTLFRKAVYNEISDDEIKTLHDVIQILHRPEYVSARETVQTYSKTSQIRLTLDCIICRSAFRALFDIILNGQEDEAAVETIDFLCTILGIQSQEVCHGAVQLNLPIISYIIRNTPEATPEAFCGLILQQANNPDVCPFNDPRFEWQVDLPAQTKTVIREETAIEPLTIALVTDFHIDPLYEANGVAECDAPTCCRIGQRPARNYIYKSNVPESVVEQSIVKYNDDVMLDLSVVPKILEMKGASRTRYPAARNAAPAGYWGDYRNCDTPIWAFDDVIDRISETHKNVDVVYYIGDTIDHGVWETTYEMINEMNLHAIDKIRSSFGDDVLVVPVIGNHEAQPTNQFAPSRITAAGLNTTWLYESLANKWSFYLSDEAKETMRAHGEFSTLIRPGLRAISFNNIIPYKWNWFAPSHITAERLNTTWLYEALANKWGFYLTDEAKATLRDRGDFSIQVKPGLRAISLNNNVAYRDNWWLVYDPTDAKRHLDWLVEELYKAEQAGEKVHILTHIPPGVHDLTHTWTREYNKIVNRFSSTIAAEFNGHTHSDEFKIFYNEEGTPINMAWGGGSATSYTFYNLNYKIVTFDTDRYEPASIQNFVYNLTEANLTPHRRPHWFQLYDMKNTFGLNDLSPASMNTLVHRMVTSDKHLLDIYSAFFSKLSDSRWSWCGEDCKLDNICKAVVTVLWERQKCNELVNLYRN